MPFPISKEDQERASSTVTSSGSLPDWKRQRQLPLHVTASQICPWRRILWLPRNSKQGPCFKNLPPAQLAHCSGGGKYNQMCQQHSLGEFIISFLWNSPEKLDNMTAILKWFSFVTGKSLKQKQSCTFRVDLS